LLHCSANRWLSQCSTLFDCSFGNQCSFEHTLVAGPSSPRMATKLQETLNATRKRLRETAANLREAQREHTVVASIVHRKVRCQHTEKVALAVYLLAGCQDDVARHYVCQKRRRKHVQNPWLADFWTARCESLTSEERAEILQPTTPSSQSVLAAAQTYMTQHALHGWIEQQNVSKAIAPTSSGAMEELVRLSQHVDGPAVPASAQSWSKPRHARQWLRRWAARFDLRRARFGVGSRLPVATARAKAIQNDKTPKDGQPESKILESTSRNRGPIFEPGKRAPNRCRVDKL